MFESISRRGFLGRRAGHAVCRSRPSPRLSPPRRHRAASFPSQDPDLVREIGRRRRTGTWPRVKELVSARPALARASWDWGFGDWETAIDAASHVGNRPIAEYLIANGARPTIYTAAMMGQLAIVKGWIESVPGGPAQPRPARHHAAGPRAERRRGRGGRAEVSRVARRRRPALHGPAGRRRRIRPRSPASTRYGTGATERLKVAKNARGSLFVPASPASRSATSCAWAAWCSSRREPRP